MRAPDFWQAGHGGWRAAILSPLGTVYGAITASRAKRKPRWTAPIPVLCVGNAVAGGAGKTQVVLDLAQRLSEQSRNVAIVMRGYGGTITGPHRVDLAVDDAAKVGDEALLCARIAPTWIGVDRIGAAKAAVATAPDVLIMDDGFQNAGLAKTCSLLVVDSDFGIGNAKCFPAGPLREPWDEACARAHAVVRLGTGSFVPNTPGLPRFDAETVPATAAPDIAGRHIVAFAGIGRPEKFFRTLESAGGDIVSRHAFGDHAPLQSDTLDALKADAHAKGALLLTTEKDLARLPSAQRDGVGAYPVSLQWDDADGLLAFLAQRL